MKVDQDWVEDNIDSIVNIFNRINRTESSGNKSNHKRKMKENMDKVIYRGYYELARKQEKDKINKSKTIGDKQERIRMDEIVESNASNTRNAIDVLEEQLDEKDKQITEKDKQITEKDKQIEKLMEIISQKLSLSSDA